VRLSTRQVAEALGVAPSTLRRWVERGAIPGLTPRTLARGWTQREIAHARVVARLRARGHRLDEIVRAARDGRLAYGYVEEVLPGTDEPVTIAEASEATGLAPELIERIWTALGLPRELERLSRSDVEALRHVAAALSAGLPAEALLQLARVYGQALAQIADAEVRLVHLYVHVPLMRRGVSGAEIAERMQGLAQRLLPLSTPIMEHVHERLLRHFIEQDVVGHMEGDLDESEALAGRIRTAIAFCDLSGYSRLTEEEGEEEALSTVERLVEAVQATLPEGARLVKTIGDEVMIVCQDVAALVDWSLGLLSFFPDRPQPRIGLHCGSVLYRDGDYYGRAVNLAARIVARASAGEVLVSSDVVAAVRGRPERHLRFESIGEIKLKGFRRPIGLWRVLAAE
jgi:adenylate cyclase